MRTADVFAIPTKEQVQQQARELRQQEHERLKAGLAEHFAGLPPTMIAQLVGRALGELCREMAEQQPSNITPLVLSMCQDRLRKAFNDGIAAAREN